ncbi:unnamed protein product [Vicia faba]|uniref:Uncharacterized protein n=1 Tax=Vicia faba TaxID=3906 RepID=A0AAV1ART5_VICFA|nr:unnamed protein product [Vicia faba]
MNQLRQFLLTHDLRSLYHMVILAYDAESDKNLDLEKQIGKDITFDLVALDKVKSFHVTKVTSFNYFKKNLATMFGIPAQFQRLGFCMAEKPDLSSISAIDMHRGIRISMYQ